MFVETGEDVGGWEKIGGEERESSRSERAKEREQGVAKNRIGEPKN